MRSQKFFALFLMVALLFSCMTNSVVFASTGVTFTAVDGTAGNTGENYTNLVDNNTNTKWCVNNGDEASSRFDGAYVVIAASQKIVVNGYTFTTANDNSKCKGRNPKSWVIYGSNDYDTSAKTGTWTAIHTVTDDTTMEDKNYTPYSFTISDNNTAYMYYKIDITANHSETLIQLSEVSFSYSIIYNITFDLNYDGSSAITQKSNVAFPAPERDDYICDGMCLFTPNRLVPKRHMIAIPAQTAHLNTK